MRDLKWDLEMQKALFAKGSREQIAFVMLVTAPAHSIKLRRTQLLASLLSLALEQTRRLCQAHQAILPPVWGLGLVNRG